MRESTSPKLLTTMRTACQTMAAVGRNVQSLGCTIWNKAEEKKRN